jgi:Na+/proline symporter/nitrogen-specific signal transduction histidine kinase
MTLAPALVVGCAVAYLLLLFGIAAWADRRAVQGRSVIGNAWVYTLSLGVYCSAWTYFGSVGRAAAGGLGFLPIYLGPTLAMILAWTLLRKIVRIARRYRITSIADFIGSRYGASGALAGAVTLLALVGVVPYVALQLKAVAGAYAVMTGSGGGAAAPWWGDGTFWIALALAAFTIAFGTRHLDGTERHEGLVAAIAAESVVKLLAFVGVGTFVLWGLFDGVDDLFGRAAAAPALQAPADGGGWFALVVLAMFSVVLLPRQFQVMVVENVDERHLKRAAWAFPAYLLAINVFVLPIAAAGLVLDTGNAETYVLALPLAGAAPALALAAFIGGLSAATGMVVVEAIAVSTMVCNDLVLPLLLRRRGAQALGATVLAIRRAVIVVLLLLGYLYFRIAGEAYALVSIGLISFAAVAQFAPALLGALYWKGGTRAGALAGLAAGALLWAYTLMLPSIAHSGWMARGFVDAGPFGIGWLRPERLFGMTGIDNLGHSLFWSLGINAVLFVGVSLWRPPSAREAARALQFVDVFEQTAERRVFWRGRAQPQALEALVGRFVGADAARALFATRPAGESDASLVAFAETQLAGAIGAASARLLVASVVEEETLALDDLTRIVEEANELRHVNERLKELDRLKDDFMSSVTHELRTPLTSIRALAELMRDDPSMDATERARFVAIIVAESERLSRLVNQVLDLAKIEAGHAEWHSADVDLGELARRAAATVAELLRERDAALELQLPDTPVVVRADADRLQQVLLNLLSNAAKFVPAGRGRVRVSLEARPDAAWIAVDDNGPGVPPAERAVVFEKFRQGDAARQQGTGLGLPISRRIVEHFGGRLVLGDSDLGGARFTFSLPRRRHEETTP